MLRQSDMPPEQKFRMYPTRRGPAPDMRNGVDASSPIMAPIIQWADNQLVNAIQMNSQIQQNVSALAQPPVFIATASNVTATNGFSGGQTYATVPLADAFDPYNICANNKVTIPAGGDGVWEFYFNGSFPSAAGIPANTLCLLNIAQNGIVVQQASVNKGSNSMNVQVVVRQMCAAGDSITFTVGYNAGVASPATAAVGGGRVSGALQYWNYT